MKNKTAEILNKNSCLPQKLLLPYYKFKALRKHQNTSCKEYIENYMSDDYYYEDHFLSFAGYPNDECPDHLTNIKFNSYNYHVFQITIGDTIDYAEDILFKYGYRKINTEETDLIGYISKHTYYQLNDVRISFDLKNNMIKEIEIYVESEYLGRLLY